jgi:hypothetical protein
MQIMITLARTTIAIALLLALRSAAAVEWQCGPHYVETIVLHGGGRYKIENERFGIVAYPLYNRTRDEKNKGNLGSDDEISLPRMGFQWKRVTHPEFRGQRSLYYRGKRCIQYPIEAQQ